MAYTTASFLAAVERRSFAPDSQNTFSSLEILEIGDEVMQSYIIPAILDVREEFFVTSYTQSLVVGQVAYDIPPRAIGMLGRNLWVVGPDGKRTRLGRAEPEQITNELNPGVPSRFYLQGNQVMLDPSPVDATYSLRIDYFLRPGQLVLTSASAIISNIDTATNIVTVSTIPSSWVTGDTFDFVKKDGAQEYRGTDYVSTLVSGTDITFSSLPTGLAVGDYVTLQATSPLIQMPSEFRPCLATLVAAEMVGSMNQPNGDKLMKKGMEQLAIARGLLVSRIQGAPQIIQADWS